MATVQCCVFHEMPLEKNGEAGERFQGQGALRGGDLDTVKELVPRATWNGSGHGSGPILKDKEQRFPSLTEQHR